MHAESNFKYGVIMLKEDNSLEAINFISKAIQINPEKHHWNEQLKQATNKKNKNQVGIHKVAPRILNAKKFIDETSKRNYS